MIIYVVNKSRHALPAHQTAQAAAADLTANIDEPITLAPLGRAAVPTGLFIELPAGYEAQVRPRSGLAANHGVTVLNAPGTIDADYRGEVKVILVNLSDQPYTVNDGDRIAQLVVAKHEGVQWQQVSELGETARGAGGFGHTGTT